MSRFWELYGGRHRSIQNYSQMFCSQRGLQTLRSRKLLPISRHCSHENTTGPSCKQLGALPLTSHYREKYSGYGVVNFTQRSLATSSGRRSLPGSLAVWVSTSQNIFANLSLEDWLYRKGNFEDESLLLLWRNQPCVVIGRHQNPWAECDVPGCRADSVRVARRNSGGGAVYHDLGNVCVSFFTSRDRYDRDHNLRLVVEAVRSRWPVDLTVNHRDDIVLDQRYKISGTAAKLGGKVAYHHLTLLTDVDKTNLERYLKTKMTGIKNHATESVRADVKNLREAHSAISFEGLVIVLSRKFWEEARKTSTQTRTGDSPSIRHVDPECEESFPGIREARAQLEGWPWVYARTPKFYIHRTFLDLSVHQPRKIDISVEVHKGVLSDVSIEGSAVEAYGSLCTMIVLSLEGTTFDSNSVENVFETSYGNVMEVESAKLYLWIWRCFRQIFM